MDMVTRCPFSFVCSTPIVAPDCTDKQDAIPLAQVHSALDKFWKAFTDPIVPNVRVIDFDSYRQLHLRIMKVRTASDHQDHPHHQDQHHLPLAALPPASCPLAHCQIHRPC